MSNEQRILDLEREKDAHEKRVKEINSELEELWKTTILEWGEKEQTKVTINGATLYIDSRWFASAKPGAAQKLAAIGEDWLVKPAVNAQTLTSWVTQTYKNEDGEVVLPEQLADVINLVRKFSIRIRGINSAENKEG